MDGWRACCIGAAFSAVIAPDHSDGQTGPGDLCRELMAFEEEVNRTLPRQIDEATELVQVKVNCETKSVAYTKRLLVEVAALAEGWEDRKQRQYVQLHCNDQGLASVNGWSAMDVFFDHQLSYVITLKASPKDCDR
jgi:hypothetical protein